MSTEVVPPVDGAPVEIDVPQTIAEFREEFPSTPKRNAPPPKEADPDRPRHRAKSQQASADDAAAIAAETKRLREAEAAIGITRKDGESERVYQLRARAEIAELAKTAKAKPVETAPVVSATPERAVLAQPAGAFSEAEPTLEQFKGQDDPYAAWQRALSRYDRRKDAFDEQQATVRERATLSQKAQADEFNGYVETEQKAHAGRLTTYVTANPDAKALMEAEAKKPIDQQIALPIAMRAAIELSPQGPQFIHELLKDPTFADDLFLLTDGKGIGDPRVDPLVAVVRRRLLQRVQAATAGSAVPARQTTVAPRPPNPARTVPQTPREKPSTDTPGSLAEHRQRFPTRH